MKKMEILLPAAVLGVCIAAGTSLLSFTTAQAASAPRAHHVAYHRKHAAHHVRHALHAHRTAHAITITNRVGAWQTPNVTTTRATGVDGNTATSAETNGNPNNVSTGPNNPVTNEPSTGPINGGSSAYGTGRTSTGTSVMGH